MAVNAYSPRSLVTTEREMLVCSSVSVTATPGTTPSVSVIEPRSPPWYDCAWTTNDVTAQQTNITRTERIQRLTPDGTRCATSSIQFNTMLRWGGACSSSVGLI